MKKAVFAFGVLSVVSGVHAGVVSGWDVSGVELDTGTGLDALGAPYVFSATTSETGHVVAMLVLGDGVSPSTAQHQYGFKIAGSAQTNSLAGAIESNHYVEFLLTVATGYELNLESIEINGEASSTGCSNVVLITSIDGFTAGQEISSVFPANKTGGFDTDSSGFGVPVDLSAAKYQNLTGTISFRLYGWNSTSGSGSTYIRNLSGNDLVVNGTVIELSSAGVLVLSLATSNGTSAVSAAFNGAAGTNYVFQYRSALSDSNGWNTVSAPFSTNTTLEIETTNHVGFYRAIAQ